jgi:predicted Zn-dependent protease
MPLVKRAIVLTGVVALAAAAAVAIKDLSQDAQYRRLLADGESALDAGQTYAAIEAFSGALALRPASMAAFYRRGEAYAAQGAEANAVRDLREAHRLAPDAAQPLTALGRLSDRAGDAAQAAYWYTQAAQRLHGASDPGLLYALGLARYRAGDATGAAEPLRLAIVNGRASAEAQYLLGLVERDSGRAGEAIEALEAAVRLTPTMLAAREELADLYAEQGRLADQRSQLAVLVTLDPQLDRLLALADADRRAGALDEALASLERASLLDPQSSRVALARARIFLAHAEATGDRAPARQAAELLETALGGTARRSEGLALLGRALFLGGDAAAGERLLEDAVATWPVETEAFSFLADAAEALGHHALARDALMHLDALQGETTPAAARGERARRLGALSLSAGDPRRAVEFLDKAVSAGVDDAGTWGLLARARWQSGDAEGGRAALARALALDAASPELRRLRQAIR